MIEASEWFPTRFGEWVESVGGVAFAARKLGLTERIIIDYCYGNPIPLTVEHACNWITSQGWRSKTIDYMPAHGQGGKARKGRQGMPRTRPVYPRL